MQNVINPGGHPIALVFIVTTTEYEESGWPPSQKQCTVRASCRAFNYAQGKTDTETNFVVTVGFTTKVDYQTTSKIGPIFEVVWWLTLVVKPTVTTKFVSVSVLPCALSQRLTFWEKSLFRWGSIRQESSGMTSEDELFGTCGYV